MREFSALEEAKHCCSNYTLTVKCSSQRVLVNADGA